MFPSRDLLQMKEVVPREVESFVAEMERKKK